MTVPLSRDVAVAPFATRIAFRGVTTHLFEKVPVMTRSVRFLPVLLVTVALLGPAPAVTAAPPTPGDRVEEFAAGEACEFAISVAYAGKAGGVALPHNPHYAAISTSPGGKATVTNLDSGKSVTVNATGAFRITEEPDGSLVIRAGGNNLLYGEPGIGATALATSGPVTLRVSATGDFVEADVSRAQVRDLCAELA